MSTGFPRILPVLAAVLAVHVLVGSVGYAFQSQRSLEGRGPFLTGLLGAPAEAEAKFQDNLWANVPSLILCIVVASVSPATGVGGGSFFVAVFATIMRWSVPPAVALSQATMAASALAGAIANSLMPHPDDSSRPVVDYSLGLVLSPGMLMGSSIGVILNAVMPSWLVSFTLTIVLGYVAYNASFKAASLVKEEQQEGKDEGSSGQDESAEPGGHGNGPEEPLLSKQKVSSFWSNYKGLIGMIAFWAVYMALEVHKREDKRCTKQYGIVTAVQVAVGIVVLVLSTIWISREQQPSSDHQGTGQGAWTLSSYAKIAVVTLFGGLLAGLLGMGGGFIIAPLMLHLGIHPSVATSTSNTVLFFSTSFAALAYERMDLLNYQFAAIFAGTCLISGAAGAAGISKLVEKLGRPSILVVLMAGIATLATVLTGISKGGKGVQDLINGHNIGFKPFCQ
ncbi:hypothetical protein WJX74_000306 [Apatococcus lobatus]|uniref:Uncharacterized protein n=2 Tax=Apatococcus TaxID=904362 RepID=A0AAW1T5X8_9CHLO